MSEMGVIPSAVEGSPLSRAAGDPSTSLLMTSAMSFLSMRPAKVVQRAQGFANQRSRPCRLGMTQRTPAVLSWLSAPDASSGERARGDERTAPPLTGNNDCGRPVASLIDVPKRTLQRLRCAAIRAQHSRKQGEEKRTARVFQLVQRHGLDAAVQAAAVRAPRQPQETFPGAPADPHSWEVRAHDHDLCPSRPLPLITAEPIGRMKVIIACLSAARRAVISAVTGLLIARR